MVATVSQTLAMGWFGGIYRAIAGIVVGLAVTAALFWAMPYMIETTDRRLDPTGSTSLVDFVRLRRDETIHRRELKPEKPLPPPLPPPPPFLSCQNLNEFFSSLSIGGLFVGLMSQSFVEWLKACWDAFLIILFSVCLFLVSILFNRKEGRSRIIKKVRMSQ